MTLPNIYVCIAFFIQPVIVVLAQRISIWNRGNIKETSQRCDALGPEPALSLKAGPNIST